LRLKSLSLRQLLFQEIRQGPITFGVFAFTGNLDFPEAFLAERSQGNRNFRAQTV
jgi:hypothetical protein